MYRTVELKMGVYMSLEVASNPQVIRCIVRGRFLLDFY